MTEATEDPQQEVPPMKVFSLDLELNNLGYAMRGAQILVDLQTSSGFLDTSSQQDAPYSISAILGLLASRLSQVRRALRGEENPSHVLEPHNEVPFEELLEGLKGVYLSSVKGQQVSPEPPPGPASA